MGDEVGGVLVEHRIAGRIGRHRNDDVGHPGEGRRRFGQRPVPIEAVDAEALFGEPTLPRVLTAGAGHPPALGEQAPGEGLGGVAETEAEQVRHAADHRCCKVLAPVVVVPP